VGEDTVADIIS
jgi:hypothetical protein